MWNVQAHFVRNISSRKQMFSSVKPHAFRHKQMESNLIVLQAFNAHYYYWICSGEIVRLYKINGMFAWPIFKRAKSMAFVYLIRNYIFIVYWQLSVYPQMWMRIQLERFEQCKLNNEYLINIPTYNRKDADNVNGISRDFSPVLLKFRLIKFNTLVFNVSYIQNKANNKPSQPTDGKRKEKKNATTAIDEYSSKNLWSNYRFVAHSAFTNSRVDI